MRSPAGKSQVSLAGRKCALPIRKRAQGNSVCALSPAARRAPRLNSCARHEEGQSRGDHVRRPYEVEPKTPKPEKKPRQKNDPKLVAAARKLRDRYLEQINTTRLLPQGKYDVSRQLEARDASPVPIPPKRLPAAA
jgi:hypothetical protein